MLFQIRMLSLVTVAILVFTIDHSMSMQSNNTCAQLPKDKRQLVCVCGKQLQLRCTFNLDIKEIDPIDMDKTLRPIYMNEVSIERAVDADDPYDVNHDLLDKQKLEENNVYLYFPNFNVLNSPYIRITFIRFMYVPSFAFIDSKLLVQSNEHYKSVSSIVFELAEINDFGIDKFAFYGVESESLVVEGPFNQLTVHEDSFRNSKIDMLTIGCYCLECETFDGECKLLFGQKSVRNQQTVIDSNSVSSKSSSFRRIKLYGVQLNDDWYLDDLPNANELEHLEISNLVSLKSEHSLVSFKLANEYAVLGNLKELHLRNDGIKYLSKNLVGLFKGLVELNLAQNEIDLIELDAFSNNPHLERLNLERNKLKYLSRHLFNSLNNLKNLNLKENQIESLEDYAFSSLKQLEYLDLTRNKFTSLNELTFFGLESLKELLLSYNPLKRIDSNAFRYLSAHSLTRLDLISNTESDWFVFEDEDICLLSHFKCQTEINIDTDQRCNCFVKYLNEISVSVARSGAAFTNSESDEEYNWFQPCTNQIDSEKQTLSENEENLYFHNRDPNVRTSSKEQQEQQSQLSCSKQVLRKCYSNDLGRSLRSDGSDDHLYNQSCLFEKFFTQRNKPSSSGSLINKLTSSIGLLSNKNLANDDFKTTQVILLNGESNNNLKEANRVSFSSMASNLVEENNRNKKFEFNQLKENENLLGKATRQAVEKNMFYILIGLLIVFTLSICSLLMSVYLMIKRNTFIYQTASSSYPVDER